MKGNESEMLCQHVVSAIILYWGCVLFWTVLISISAQPVVCFSATRNPDPSLPELGTTKNVATQILQGVGPVSSRVLNDFNLDDLEKIAGQWTANLVQKAADEEAKLQLGCVNGRELFVDTVTTTFPRIPGSGLGP